MPRAKYVFVMLVLLAIAFAPVQLESPTPRMLQGGETVDLGTIGPGQTVTLEIAPRVEEGGVHGIGGRYDLAIIAQLPEGWRGKDSKIYDDPLQVVITADPNAREGEYTARVVVVDEQGAEGLDNITFNVRVRITWDVMDSEVTPARVETGPGQPARYYVTITNKANTGDVFEIRAQGVERWGFSKQTYVPPQSSKTIFYEIVEEEEEYYQATLEVVSTSSNRIREEHPVEFQVASNLLADYKATNNGMLLFPIFESPIYALAGLLSNLIG